MNSFERIGAAIMGEKADRKAFTATLSQYGSKYCGASNQEYYQNPDVYLEGQKNISEKFETDVIFGPFALALIGKAFGAELKFYPDRPPLVKKPLIQSVDELLSFPLPDINTNPDLVYQCKCIKLLTSHFGTSVPVAAISLNPVDLPIMIYGLEKWLDIFLFDKKGFDKTMDYITPFFIEYTNTLLANGAACVIMPTVFANSSVVTRQQTIEIVNPLLVKAFSQIKGGLIMHHGGVPFLPYLDTYKDFPENVIGFALDFTDNYQEARNKVGKNRVILSGPEGPSLYTKSSEQIKNECLRILTEAEEDNKHILITCSSDILLQTPEETIKAIGEAIIEFYTTTLKQK